jgi:hypothetical protein
VASREFRRGLQRFEALDERGHLPAKEAPILLRQVGEIRPSVKERLVQTGLSGPKLGPPRPERVWRCGCRGDDDQQERNHHERSPSPRGCSVACFRLSLTVLDRSPLQSAPNGDAAARLDDLLRRGEMDPANQPCIVERVARRSQSPFLTNARIARPRSGGDDI